jgi:mono/diheme cytochrome c family protein/glucose/arabinose dehydrogenase
MRNVRHILFCCFFCPWLLQCSTRDAEGPSPAKTAQEELKTFAIEEGLQAQLVVSEPVIEDPVVITFDEDGRMWVVEMRGFMPDIDGKGERDPVGRVSILEDTDGDGVSDKHTVYIDSLIMPRALAVVKGGALVVEQEALWYVSDTNGDGKADKKALIDKDYAGSKMPEHSGNGLLRAMDNWYYNAKSRFRYALKDGKWIRDSTEFRGQWGISQDDFGRLYYNYNWSQLHADLVPPNYLSRNRHHEPTSGIDYGVTIDRRVYPIRDNPAVNRGYIPGTLNEAGRLLEFTAACSPFYYRGNAFEASYHDNVYVCEPSGNLVKRNRIKRNGLYVGAYDPHPGREFMASTDERFRPVYITAGPDGALYLADMYRGLIQHGAYVTPYLREQTISRKLVKPVDCGRIWRIAPASFRTQKPEKLSQAGTGRLIELLRHPNGWYRDMAQRLLVERNDTAARTKLEGLVTDGSQPVLARLHALWTLQGVNGLRPALLLPLLTDNNEVIRIHALRLLEPFASNDASIAQRVGQAIQKFVTGTQPEMLQGALSAYVLTSSMRLPLLKTVLLRSDTCALLRDAVMSSAGSLELDMLKSLMSNADWKTASPSREIVVEMMTAAILRERNANKLAGLLALIHIDLPWSSRSILTGLVTQGAAVRKNPVTLSSEPAIFQQTNMSRIKDTQAQQKVQQLAGLFAWPGHTPDPQQRVAGPTLADADLEQFALGRKHYLATCAGCHGTDGAGMKRMAPPLAGSDWVLGNEKRLVLLILHGLEGPVDVAGKKYDAPDILPVMPSHSTMDDGAIRAVMTYIRNEWGNSAPPISGRLVGKTRHTSQGRVQPWTPNELNTFIEKNPEVSELQ